MKNINHDTFLHDLDSGLIHGQLSGLIHGQLSKKCKDPYDKLTELFRDALGYHAPIKQTFVSGNPATFMANESRKAIMSKSKTKNILNSALETIFERLKSRKQMQFNK